jgi:hypothetical protein
MSWELKLNDKEGKPVEVDVFEEGGTYAVGGTNLAELNVTYNYGKVLREVWNGESLTLLNGKNAGRMLKLLRDSVKVLGTKQDNDYWNATEGNVGYMLNILLTWAEANPDAVFEVY